MSRQKQAQAAFYRFDSQMLWIVRDANHIKDLTFSLGHSSAIGDVGSDLIIEQVASALKDRLSSPTTVSAFNHHPRLPDSLLG